MDFFPCRILLGRILFLLTLELAPSCARTFSFAQEVINSPDNRDAEMKLISAILADGPGWLVVNDSDNSSKIKQPQSFLFCARFDVIAFT